MASPIRIAVLECDDPVFTSIKKRGNYGGIFASLLKAAAPEAGLSEDDLVFSTYNVVRNTTNYPRLEDIDGVLLSGSKYDAHADDDWTNKLVSFVKEILAQNRVRIIGVCYGHQIVGRALGVKCGRSDKGWEVSVSKVDLTEDGKKLFQKDDLTIMQMHQDILYEYPPEVNKLGSSPLCLVQGMYTQRRLITLQGHPEFTQDIVIEFLTEEGHPEFTQDIMAEILEARLDQGRFTKDVFENAMSRSSLPHDGLHIAAGFLRFMKDGPL